MGKQKKDYGDVLHIAILKTANDMQASITLHPVGLGDEAAFLVTDGISGRPFINAHTGKARALVDADRTGDAGSIAYTLAHNIRAGRLLAGVDDRIFDGLDG